MIAVPEEYGHHILGKECCDSFFNRNMLQTPFKADVNPDILTNHVRYSSEIEDSSPTRPSRAIVR